MFLQGRVAIVWLSWLVGGVCGVVLLLLIVCYCRLMPRHPKHKSFDEQYFEENYTFKEKHAPSSQENCRNKHAEAQRASSGGPSAGTGAVRRAPPPPSAHYASSSVLDEAETGGNGAGADARPDEVLKTRSLPGAARSARHHARPLSAAPAGAQPVSALELESLLAKMSLSKKKYKNHMRSEHAAIIALSKSRSQLFDADSDVDAEADAVIVYHQRTQL